MRLPSARPAAALAARALLLGATVAAVAPRDAAAQPSLERLSIHGYASLGAAISDKQPVIGIPTSGTQDYRAAALLFRYSVDDKRAVVFQLANRQFGASPLSSGRSDVILDWAFYQRKWDNGLSMRAGRVPLARGIYNETRVVGTLLPFFRAPYNFYTESFTSLDGASVNYQKEGAGFGVDGTVYGGGFDYVVGVPNATTGSLGAFRTRGEQTVGGQVWLTTPLPGVRFGAHAMRFRLNDRLNSLQSAKPLATLVTGSVDGNWGRLTLRGEATRQNATGLRYDAWYGQAGVKVHDKLSIWAQDEHADIDTRLTIAPGRTAPISYPFARDRAVSANFTLSPSLVFRLEGHRARGYFFDRYAAPVVPSATGLRPNARPETSYGIASLAVSF